MINIYDYLDYQKFLMDYYNYNKNISKSFTYQSFATKSGIVSRSTVKKIFDGQRKISIKTLPKIIKGLELSRNEENFFKLLVEYSAESGDKKEKLLSQIKMTPGKLQLVELKEKWKNTILNSWMHIAVFSILRLKECDRNIKNASNWIAKKIYPEVDPNLVQVILKDLLMINFLEVKDQTYQICDQKNLGFVQEDTELENKYKKEIIDLSKHSIGLPSDEVFHGTVALNIKSSDRKKISKKIDSFIQELIGEFYSTNESEEVYQFNAQFFPISK